MYWEYLVSDCGFLFILSVFSFDEEKYLNAVYDLLYFSIAENLKKNIFSKYASFKCAKAVFNKLNSFWWFLIFYKRVLSSYGTYRLWEWVGKKRSKHTCSLCGFLEFSIMKTRDGCVSHGAVKFGRSVWIKRGGLDSRSCSQSVIMSWPFLRRQPGSTPLCLLTLDACFQYGGWERRQS